MKLIKLKNDYYLISNEPFNEKSPKGTAYYDGRENIRSWSTGNSFDIRSKNILASTIKLDNIPLINVNELTDLIPLTCDYRKSFNEAMKHTRYENLSMSSEIGDGFIHGYDQAIKEKQEFKFTLEDISKALNYGSRLTNNKIKYMNDYINDLKKDKNIWDVVLDLEEYADYDFTGMPCVGLLRPKVVNGYIKITSIKAI